jgi:hypothetical protein
VTSSRGTASCPGHIDRVNICNVILDRRHCSALAIAALLLGAVFTVPTHASTIYKWVDADGTVHLSSSKPPPGVTYQAVEVGSSPGSGKRGSTTGGSGARSGSSTASPAQAAQRSEVLASLRNRECVIALEALDRLTSGTQPTSAAEIARLKQTADANCSSDPVRRREQDQMAAKLRVANGPECLKARDTLADMTAKRTQATPEQLRAQQAFVDAHCIPPVQ